MGHRAAPPAARWPATERYLRARRARAVALLGTGVAGCGVAVVALLVALPRGLDAPVGASGPVVLVATAVALPALGFGGVEALRLRRLVGVLGRVAWRATTASVVVAVGGTVRRPPDIFVGLRLEGRGTVERTVAAGPSRSRVLLHLDGPTAPLWLADPGDGGLAVVSPAGGGDPVVVRPPGARERAARTSVDLDPPTPGAHESRITR